MRRLIAVAFFLLYAGFALWPETKIDPFVMPSARFSALGGNHAAMADDFYALFLNPASFAGVKEEFSAAELTVSTYGPMLELLDLARSADGSDIDISGLVDSGNLALGFDIGGPLSLGWVGRGLGLGIFNRIRTSAAVSGVKLKPLVSGELLFAGGYAFRIIDNGSHVFDAGFLGKGFFRGALNLEASSIFTADTALDDPMNQPFVTHLGLGLDLGVRYSFRENLTAALVCYDVYSPVLLTPYDTVSGFIDKSGPSRAGSSYATVKRRVDAGVQYRIRSAFIDRYISRLSLMADYHDFLDLFSLIPRNPILNIGLGVEVQVLNALTLRAGISDALPAVGFGLDLSFMILDFAIHGRELGLDPGKQSVYAMAVGMMFRY